jgi:hypothetical protein
MRIILSILTACFMLVPVYGLAGPGNDGGGAPLFRRGGSFMS